MSNHPEGSEEPSPGEDQEIPRATPKPVRETNGVAHHHSFKVVGKPGEARHGEQTPPNQNRQQFSQVTARSDLAQPPALPTLPTLPPAVPEPGAGPSLAPSRDTGPFQKQSTDGSMRQGTRPGDRYVKVLRTTPADVQRIAPKYVQLQPGELGSQGLWARFKRFLIGRPIETTQSHHQRLNKIRALAILASDALSSVAYGTEASLFILVTAFVNQKPIDYIVPISIVISILIVLVVNSYRQTVYAYPQGGGSYIVSKDNLGVNAGLIAAGAILIDYTLTVAVSVSAGVAAITSAFPALNGDQVLIGVGVIVLIMIANLRGLKESGTIFAIPTYLFVVSFLGMIAFGLFKVLTGDFTPYPADLNNLKQATTEIPGFNMHSVSIFLLLQAFAAGCSAMTGVEAISDGVQAFQKPESKNAEKTLIVMGALLIVLFMGTSFLALHLNALPDDPNNPDYETVVSKIGRAFFGGSSPFYFLIQFTTALILILAANTAFADFPRLSFFLARDKFLPNIFGFRGDRLAFTTGIVVLTGLSAGILAIFNGHTDALIPLYAVGVFTAFTLSQSGMVVHWQKEKLKGVKGVTRSQLFNAVGAVATGIVLIIIIVTKFLVGAWLVVILIPLLFMMFKAIHRHYAHVNDQLTLPENAKAQSFVKNLPINGSRSHTIIVPISRVNKVSLMTLDFARSLGESVTALFISDDPEAVEDITKQWQQFELKIPLVVLENPFRSIIPPLLNYIDKVDMGDPDDILMVVLPEFVARHWWELLLHNQTALRIKQVLLFKPGVVVVDVPYHLRRAGDTEAISSRSF
jgi:amino acid transporter